MEEVFLCVCVCVCVCMCVCNSLARGRNQASVVVGTFPSGQRDDEILKDCSGVTALIFHLITKVLVLVSNFP